MRRSWRIKKGWERLAYNNRNGTWKFPFYKSNKRPVVSPERMFQCFYQRWTCPNMLKDPYGTHAPRSENPPEAILGYNNTTVPQLLFHHTGHWHQSSTSSWNKHAGSSYCLLMAGLLHIWSIQLLTSRSGSAREQALEMDLSLLDKMIISHFINSAALLSCQRSIIPLGSSDWFSFHSVSRVLAFIFHQVPFGLQCIP